MATYALRRRFLDINMEMDLLFVTSDNTDRVHVCQMVDGCNSSVLSITIELGAGRSFVVPLQRGSIHKAEAREVWHALVRSGFNRLPYGGK
jgi:hypothetical protein